MQGMEGYGLCAVIQEMILASCSAHTLWAKGLVIVLYCSIFYTKVIQASRLIGYCRLVQVCRRVNILGELNEFGGEQNVGLV